MASAVPAHAQVSAPEGLRERKKRLTREAIFAAARRLFAERGFDEVTVAEIADAANISVKTLFTYVRSKEELVFGDGPTLLDAVVTAVRDRRLGETPLVAAAKALLAAVDEQSARRPDGGARARGRSATGGNASGDAGIPAKAASGDTGGPTTLEAFSQMVRSGPEAQSRLRALWAQAEDALTLALVKPKDGPRERAARRLEAAQIMVLVRAVTSEEVRDLVAAAGADAGGQKARQAQREALREWIRDAAGSLARGLQATRR
jgi:AcrR family transcriptional regulator